MIAFYQTFSFVTLIMLWILLVLSRRIAWNVSMPLTCSVCSWRYVTLSSWSLWVDKPKRVHITDRALLCLVLRWLHLFPVVWLELSWLYRLHMFPVVWLELPWLYRLRLFPVVWLELPWFYQGWVKSVRSLWKEVELSSKTICYVRICILQFPYLLKML